MGCQGLQFGRVNQTAGNLQLYPTRFQAEQSLEQQLTLRRRRGMFCITIVEQCLEKGRYLDLGRTNNLIDSYWKIIALPVTTTPRWFMLCMNAAGHI